MSVEFDTANPPAAAARIAELEKRIGHQLPVGYRHFLLRQDGGYIAAINTEALEEVFSVSQSEPDYGQIWAYLGHLTDGSLPPGLLPVASDSEGNYFAVSLRAEDEGSVWFVHHEAEQDDNGVITPIEVIRKAASWPEFLASVQPIDA
jgi:cell wall assembly regulator SMI1